MAQEAAAELRLAPLDKGSENFVVHDDLGFANGISPLNPALNPIGCGPCNVTTGAGCYQGIDPSFASNYDYPLTDILGMVTNATAVYNYGKDLSLLAPGTPITPTGVRTEQLRTIHPGRVEGDTHADADAGVALLAVLASVGNEWNAGLLHREHRIVVR